MNTKNPKVDAFIDRADKWQDEFKALRTILQNCPLTEELKWGVPCYAYESRNVVLMHGFNEYCALMFIKGALLKDPAKILITQTENVQSARQVRFTSVYQIIELEPVLKAYILEAIDNQRSGLKVEFKKTSEFAMVEEFRSRIDADSGLKAAFEALTPGRQRAYLLFFSAPKQARTREARVEKSIPQILNGIGLND